MLILNFTSGRYNIINWTIIKRQYQNKETEYLIIDIKNNLILYSQSIYTQQWALIRKLKSLSYVKKIFSLNFLINFRI